MPFDMKVWRGPDLRGRVAESVALFAVIALCVGAPVAMASASGSLRIPHFDDWSFTRVALTYFDTGQLHLTGSNAMMLVGQLAWARPFTAVFGESVRSLNISGAAAAGLALAGTYLVARRFLRARLALLATLLMGVFPAFGPLAMTFMTDPPAFAAETLSLGIGLAGLACQGRSRLVALSVSLVIGMFGFTIREAALAAPLAVLVGWTLDEIHRGRRPLRPLIVGVTLLALAGGLYLWRHGLRGDTSPGEGEGLTLGPSLVVSAGFAYFTLTVGVLPAISLLGSACWKERARLSWRLGALAASVLALVCVLYPKLKSGRFPDSLFLGYVFHMRGPWGNQALLGDRELLFPAPFWVLLNVAAFVAGVLLAGYLACRVVDLWARRSTPPREQAIGLAVLLAYASTTIAGIALLAVLGGATYERYLWGIALVLVVLVLREVRSHATRTRIITSGVALGAVVVTSFALVAGGQAFDVARWHAGTRAEGLGVNPRDTDAGLEWVGFHYRGLAHEKHVARRWRPPARRYMDDFPRAGNCLLVSTSALDDPQLIPRGTIRYRPFLIGEYRRLLLYRNPPGCRATR
jgi:hypothetical protein